MTRRPSKRSAAARKGWETRRAKAEQARRSEAARLGWETRKAKAADQEAARAARSAAARKGWETRRARAAEQAQEEGRRAAILAFEDRLRTVNPDCVVNVTAWLEDPTVDVRDLTRLLRASLLEVYIRDARLAATAGADMRREVERWAEGGPLPETPGAEYRARVVTRTPRKVAGAVFTLEAVQVVGFRGETMAFGDEETFRAWIAAADRRVQRRRG